MASNASILGSLQPPPGPPPPTGSLRVRAPVTLDDDSFSSDIEYNSEEDGLNSRKNTVSVASTSSSLEGDVSDYDEFGSGEEGFETASEWHFEGDPDGGTRGKSGIADKGSEIRHFLGGQGEESVDVRCLGVVEELRPIARMSMQDDEFHELVGDTDDGGLSEEEEDVRMSPGAIQNFGVLERMEFAPRVRFLDVDEEDDEIFEEDELVVQEDYSLVGHSEPVNFSGEPVTVAMEGELDKPSSEGVNHFTVEDKKMNEDAKHDVEKSVQSDLNEYAIHDLLEERRADSFVASELVFDEGDKLVSNEVVQMWEQQLQKFIVEDGGVKESMECSSDDVFTVDPDEPSNVAETAVELQQMGLMSNNVREEFIDDVSGQTKHLTAGMERATSDVEIVHPLSRLHKVVDTVNDSLSKEDDEMIKTIQLIRVKFLRFVHRLGLHSKDSLVSQVLNRLALVAGEHTIDDFNLESAENLAMELEAKGKDDLEFSLNILVLGKTGVGKSATVNSIFGEKKVTISPFGPGFNKVKEVSGIVNGIKVRVLDTPGFRPSVKEDATNRKVLASIKTSVSKCAPDIVLYVDRLDNQARDLMDLPLLKSISHYLTPEVWKNVVITLTHGASPLPDSPTGSPLRFEFLVAQRSHAIQHAISQAIGDPRLMRPSMMHPVSVVENNTSGLKDDNGEVLLPNGQSWRTHLLLLCYSLKILSEASFVEKPRDTYGLKKYFGFRRHSLSLPHLVSSLLQSRQHPKLTTEQGGGDVDSDIELDMSDSDEEGDNEYDRLLPFKPLRKSQVDRLSKEQKKVYFEEYDYRAKLFQRKEWKEELKRLKEKKAKGQYRMSGSHNHNFAEDEIQEDGMPFSTPVPIPDLALPPSFDGADPSFRYRGLQPTSQLLARPVLDPRGWDHDCGYDGVSIESNLPIAGKFPCAFALQVTKDKEEFNIHLDSSVCTKHGKSGSSMAGFDILTVGEQLAYVLRGETIFRNSMINKTSTGISVTLLGESIATGIKIHDQLIVGKRLVLVGSGGAVRNGADTACGAAFEVRLRSKNFPVDQEDQSSLGLSLMKWQGGLGVMATLQSQLLIGRNSKVAIRVGMTGRRSGQITLKTTSSDLHIALISMLPVVMSIFRSTCCLRSNS